MLDSKPEEHEGHDLKCYEKHLDPEKQVNIEAVVSKSKLKMQHWTIYWVF